MSKSFTPVRFHWRGFSCPSRCPLGTCSLYFLWTGWDFSRSSHPTSPDWLCLVCAFGTCSFLVLWVGLASSSLSQFSSSRPERHDKEWLFQETTMTTDYSLMVWLWCGWTGSSWRGFPWGAAWMATRQERTNNKETREVELIVYGSFQDQASFNNCRIWLRRLANFI